MKAALHTKYNKTDIALEIREIATPELAPNQVRVRVKTAGVNPLDNMITRGQVKMIVPYKMPQVAGNELVGVIEAVGADVKGFQIGDRVFARLPLDQIGAFAEEVAVDQDALAKVPEYLSDVEAAAIPLTALTVMQALELMDVKPGKTIFISGGTGGLGGMAIPIAKAKGLTVITNGNGSGEERVKALGADQFIDYKKEDYANVVSDVDYVIDTLGRQETEKQMKILKKGGKIVSLIAMPNGDFARRMNLPKWKQIILSLAGRKFDKMAEKNGVKYYFIFVKSNGAQLQEAANILDEIKLKPSIDQVFAFENVNDALEKISRGGSRGKTVLEFK
ncbi:MAG: NADP-dependent oxidoreductase [Limosilactobacillus sp.]|uniref:NADP-dependent oxidoreductase n=1 Tax=Limosilactobacillus sp. TaxID=2773925 RepID=UPI002708BE64|nr:NADP-dependent oxidoreductase [Limosilactobacillus sp.]